jgi:hypothetical protein
MRIELHHADDLVICALYSRAGELLGRGCGRTEEGARVCAAHDWGDRAAAADSARFSAAVEACWNRCVLDLERAESEITT